MLSVIVIKSHLVNVFNNNRPNSKQTLILPVHIKSQLSYAAITEKFCIRKLTRKIRMVSRSWQNCLEGPQNCPQGWGFCLICFAPGTGFRKNFLHWAGNLTTLKRFPGDQPGGGRCWCLELTDALSFSVSILRAF